MQLAIEPALSPSRGRSKRETRERTSTPRGGKRRAPESSSHSQTEGKIEAEKIGRERAERELERRRASTPSIWQWTSLSPLAPHPLSLLSSAPGQQTGAAPRRGIPPSLRRGKEKGKKNEPRAGGRAQKEGTRVFPPFAPGKSGERARATFAVEAQTKQEP